MIKRPENTVPWRYVISDLKGEEIVETFYEFLTFCKKQIKEFRIEKVTKRKHCVLNGKITVVLLTVGLIKKT